MQHGVAGAIGRRAGALRRRALAHARGHAAEGPLVDAPILGARERHTVVLEFDDGVGRLLAHVLDGVLVAQPVGALHRVVHVPAPVVLAHVAQRGADAALCGYCVTAGGKHLGDTGRAQALFRQAESGAQPRTACTDYHHVVTVIDDLVCGTHFSVLRWRSAGPRRCPPWPPPHAGTGAPSATAP